MSKASVQIDENVYDLEPRVLIDDDSVTSIRIIRDDHNDFQKFIKHHGEKQSLRSKDNLDPDHIGWIDALPQVTHTNSKYPHVVTNYV